MSSYKNSESRASSSGRNTNRHQPPRFTWHTSKTDRDSAPQPKSPHHQPQRFFGSSSHLWFSDRRDYIKDEMVPWENTFSMRACNLNQFNTNSNYRSTYRSQTVALQRCRMGFISGAVKSLDILRQNLQKNINKEIDDVLQKYLKKFFRIAIENIKRNNGEQAVSDSHVQTVCRQILEEAKKMYQVSATPASTNSTGNHVAEAPLPPPPPEPKPTRPHPKTKKRKISDPDSEPTHVIHRQRKKKKGRPPVHYHTVSPGRATPLKIKLDHVKRDGPKWNPDRLTTDTLFIMGAKANKVLGLGATRGRLYIKHPEVFKYSGDQEDKQWLYDHNLMPATGGKAYMLLVEDIKELAKTDEYRNSPALMMNEIVGFAIPEVMLVKMRQAMLQMRTDAPVRRRGRPAVTAVEEAPKAEGTNSIGKFSDSRTGTPTDDLFLMGADLPSSDRSPFSLGTGFDDISPTQADISPTTSDMSATLDPPLTASFDVSTTP